MIKDHNQLIYIVDDDEPFNNMIRLFLENYGFKRIKSFYNGKDLLKELTTKEPVIIIQDYDMPEINGIDILKKVKPDYPNIEFIFLSGQSKIEVAVDAIKYGAFDYILKDKFAKENVYTKIRNILKIVKLSRDRKAYIFGMVSFASLFAIIMLILTIFFVGK